MLNQIQTVKISELPPLQGQKIDLTKMCAFLENSEGALTWITPRRITVDDILKQLQDSKDYDISIYQMMEMVKKTHALSEENAKLKQQIKNQELKIQRLETQIATDRFNRIGEAICDTKKEFDKLTKEAEELQEMIKLWQQKPKKQPNMAIVYGNGTVQVFFDGSRTELITRAEYESRNYNL